VRRRVRKATKVGVAVEPAEMSEAFVKGIVDIYSETPAVRQGKAFWHIRRKPAELVRVERDVRSAPAVRITSRFLASARLRRP